LARPGNRTVIIPASGPFHSKGDEEVDFCHFTTRCLQSPDNLIFVCNVRQVQEYLKIDQDDGEIGQDTG